MKNWTTDENEAMKGYILLASRFLNNGYKAEDYKGNVISDDLLRHLFRCIDRATDEMTAEQARAYYNRH